MTIYHASNTEVPFPDTLHSRDFLDFGKGFYVTTIREQAERYAQAFYEEDRQLGSIYMN